MKGRLDPAKILPQILAPIGALILAITVSSIALVISDKDPVLAYTKMIEFGSTPDSQADILNKATYYYIVAVAVAIGFRMGLFNIGVDGQLRLAAICAAALGGASFLSGVPGEIKIIMMIIVSMVVGAAWAGIAALLKVTRGVSEVISTIMLNAIGGGLVFYLLNEDRWAVKAEGSNSLSTPILAESSWVPSIPLIPGAAEGVLGFLPVAVALGVLYWFGLSRTRPGFDLRAAGFNPAAAVASGVDAKRMVIYAMLLSGAVAGLGGMPQLLGEYHAFTQDFGGQLGFTGIAIALLGRNHPIGMAAAALLWGFLARSQLILDLEQIPKEIIQIMQGTTVLAVVIAYELAGRLGRRAQQKRAALSAQATEPVVVGAGRESA
jgi:simple sugar transport system permease protein